MPNIELEIDSHIESEAQKYANSITGDLRERNLIKRAVIHGSVLVKQFFEKLEERVGLSVPEIQEPEIKTGAQYPDAPTIEQWLGWPKTEAPETHLKPDPVTQVEPESAAE